MLDGWTSCGMEMQNARHALHLSAGQKLIATPDQSPAPEAKVTESILQRVAAGDRAAVKECLDTYGDLVWSLARRFNSAHADAEDAVQDIFIDIWTHAGRFDPSKASETTFVATITRRRLIDRLRKQGRRPFHDDIDDTVLPADLDRSLKPETGVELDIVAEAMSTLRPEQQEVLQLSVVEGYSHSAVAERLSMPLGTVKTHVRRGLIRIREELEMSETEDGALT
jgi:RNA polymerase sigma-70 factor (ECF subfamily)